MMYVLFTSPEHLKRFLSYLKCHHINISFATENGKDNRMSFLFVNTIRKQGNFTTSV